MPTIAHLSDTHLDTSPQRERRFTAVLDQVAELPNIDALIVSGDLADTGTPEEYEQFFAALKRAGVTTEMVRFPDEGHELSRGGSPRHRVERFDILLDWHRRFLRAAGTEA